MQLEAIKKDEHFEVLGLEGLNIKTEKIILNFDYDAYLKEEMPISHNKPSEKNKDSLQAKFNEILGEFSQKRGNVSIGEDRKILMDALWDKYGQ